MYETCVFSYVPVCMCVLVSEVNCISYGKSRSQSLKTPALLTLLTVSLPPHLRGAQSPLVPAQHGSVPHTPPPQLLGVVSVSSPSSRNASPAGLPDILPLPWLMHLPTSLVPLGSFKNQSQLNSSPTPENLSSLLTLFLHIPSPLQVTSFQKTMPELPPGPGQHYQATPQTPYPQHASNLFFFLVFIPGGGTTTHPVAPAMGVNVVQLSQT